MISIVVPAYNEEAGIETLHQRITAAAGSWGRDHELILVDDGSTDRTLEICERIADHDPRFKVVSFTRNFGHQAAVSAGLQHARGDVVAVMDADLQDPPEELAAFLRKLDEGYDVVYAVRTRRKEGAWKRASYFLFYRLMRWMATVEIPLDAGDFCVMRAEVVQAVNAMPERNRFVRGLRSWVGFRQVGLAYERQARFAGSPKYTLRKLVKLAFDGLLDFSYKPLQFSMLGGLLVGASAMALAALVFVLYVMDWTVWGYNPRAARGWTSLMLVLLFSLSVQLFCLGCLGEYLGRLYEETKRRPLYLVRRRFNIAPPERPGAEGCDAAPCPPPARAGEG